MEQMKQRIQNIQRRIEIAAQKTGRQGKDITLIAVSKTVDSVTAQMAYDLGIRDFGENRVQELNSKMLKIPEARWHMIGRLQTNKIKDIAGKASLIHSVDRWRLAEAINKWGQHLGIQIPILLEVNISGEEQKAGLEVNEVERMLESINQLSAVKVYGFMTMAAMSSDPETTRPIFRELANLNNSLKNKNYPNVELEYLSMGMSQDFEVAIEEGSNMVRIGSAIFNI